MQDSTLDEKFREWVKETGKPSDTAYLDMDEDDKAEFGLWLMDYYASHASETV